MDGLQFEYFLNDFVKQDGYFKNYGASEDYNKNNYEQIQKHINKAIDMFLDLPEIEYFPKDLFEALRKIQEIKIVDKQLLSVSISFMKFANYGKDSEFKKMKGGY